MVAPVWRRPVPDDAPTDLAPPPAAAQADGGADRPVDPDEVSQGPPPAASSVGSAGADAGGATLRLELPVRAERREVVAAHLWTAGAAGVWERPDRVVAWFVPPAGPAADLDPDDLLPAPEHVPELSPQARSWSLEPDRDWQAAWKATIRPVQAGRTMIVPSWLADDHVPAPDELTLVLDPGRAFGTGHHATTTLCLELLDELDLAGRLAGRTLADIGCGTGVLAIAAAARGAAVTAVDVDPDAVAVCDDNARRNTVALTTAVGSVDVLDGDVEVVVANLITATIRDLAPDLVAATTDVLIVSGIASERADDTLACLTAAGARLVERRERDGWVAARLARTRTGDGTDPRARP